MPTAAGVARALAGPLSDPGLGGTPHVEVVDALTGRVLLDRLGRVPTIPASTQKLLAAAAALMVLGPRTRLTTRVMVSGQDLYLVGGGDPTLTAAPVFYGAYPASTDLSALAAAVNQEDRCAFANPARDRRGQSLRGSGSGGRMVGVVPGRG